MFKHARRRIEKSEQERELGLTPEIKEDLGLNDTESESDSDTSDPRVSLSDSESSGSERPSRKRKRPLDDGEGESDAGESDDGDHASEDQEEDSESDADAKSADGGPTVSEALNNPLFFVSDDQQACAVCPGKRLKNRHMADLHTAATVRPTSSMPHLSLTRCAAPQTPIQPLQGDRRAPRGPVRGHPRRSRGQHRARHARGPAEPARRRPPRAVRDVEARAEGTGARSGAHAAILTRGD